MIPIKTAETNFAYIGTTPEMADLLCRVDNSCCYSVWTFTEEERKAIAAGGNLRLGVLARPIPPVSLIVVPNDHDWRQIPTVCAVCKRDVSDEIHDISRVGTGYHAFKVER